MSAIAFTDPANFAGVRFPDVSRQEADQFYFEPDIYSAYSFEGIIGRSSGIRRVLEQVAIVAPTDSTVLLHGETGTGKELIARKGSLHRGSHPTEGPLRIGRRGLAIFGRNRRYQPGIAAQTVASCPGTGIRTPRKLSDDPSQRAADCCHASRP